MKIKRYQFNNIPFVSIVNQNDCPVDPYISNYINCCLTSYASHTTDRYVNELLFVLSHFKAHEIDLIERIASGKLITQSEYFSFYEQALLCKSALTSRGKEHILTSIESKFLRNTISANARQEQRVSNETVQGRIRRLRSFIEWLFIEFHGDRQIQLNLEDRYTKLISRISLDESSFGRNRNKSTAPPSDSVIPDEIFRSLIEIVHPSSPNNPFKSAKIRNYLIIAILVQSGIRRGALAKIKVSDCHFYASYDRISIYRTKNDPSDPRHIKPNQKTKSHYATIEKSLMEHIKFYIDHIRSQFPRSHTHDFLFVSEKNSKGTIGLPLSLQSINTIFNTLSSHLDFQITPHLLRHKWNEIFDLACEDKLIHPGLREDIRKYAMGWSQNSSMAEIYNEKRLAKKAWEISLTHQARVNGHD